jgi:integrase
MPKPLSAKYVEKVQPDPTRRLEIPDGLLPGFYLVVQPTGAKSWAVRYRAGGRPTKLTIGKVSAIELKKARDLARKHLEAVSKGQNPAAEKRAARATKTITLPETVGALCDEYIKRYLKPNVRRWKAAEGEIDNHIRPRLGKLPLKDLARAHVRGMVREIEATYPVAANRALARLNAVLNWAVAEDLIEANPAAGVKRPTRETPADRILDDDELKAVWGSVDSLAYPAQQFMRLLILTGQRRDDVRLMHWDEINLAEKTWIIPASRYKSRRPHLVPLTDETVAVLKAMPFKDRGGYVLTTTAGKKPYANVQKPKAAVDKKSGVTGWTLHDLRRTCRTGLSRLGIRSDIAERVIGHAVGGKLGQTYDLYEFAEEKRRALEAWERHVLGLNAGNVVALHG